MTTPRQSNLFGSPGSARVSKFPRANGYAARPGTGPAGETCKSCMHCRAKQLSCRVVHKCWLMERGWTFGRGTDVLVKSPACALWGAAKKRDQ